MWSQPSAGANRDAAPSKGERLFPTELPPNRGLTQSEFDSLFSKDEFVSDVGKGFQ